MAVLAEPTVVAGIVAAAVSLVTLVVNAKMKAVKQRSEVRHSDQELLSMSEKEFRLTLIKDLQQCRDNNTKIQRANMLCEKANIELTRKVMLLEVRLASHINNQRAEAMK